MITSFRCRETERIFKVRSAPRPGFHDRVPPAGLRGEDERAARVLGGTGQVMKTLVVLPSYNESENIERLLRRILALGPQYFTCVVDDSSPDGTGAVVERLQSTLEPIPEIAQSDRPSEGQPSKAPARSDLEKKGGRQVHLIVRSHKNGRGGAVRSGIEWGLRSEEAFEVFIEMDCDFSHMVEDIPIGMDLLAEADVVMGSRYPDGKIIGWPWHRKVLSFLANLLARALIRWRVADYTSGFRFYNRAAAELMCRLPQRHKGYIYLSETMAHVLEAGLRVRSFPIVFVNRVKGKSNTTLREISEAFLGILAIAWRHWRGQDCKTQGVHRSHG
jgi:dolichol-phosphate mannosyltransferase